MQAAVYLVMAFVIASHECYVRINLYLLQGRGKKRIQLFADGHRQSREGQTDSVSGPLPKKGKRIQLCAVVISNLGRSKLTAEAGLYIGVGGWV